MFKKLFIAATLVFAFQAQASTELGSLSLVKSVVTSSQALVNPNWKVGDSADYKLSGGILNGTMKMSVREVVSNGTWLVQDMDLGMFGKQKVEILYADNGEILELIVNGQKQTPPSPGDQEIVETRNESVTVPKGTFACIYVKIKDVKSGAISQAWIDMTQIPVSGMAKSISPTQMGDVTIELTNFNKMP